MNGQARMLPEQFGAFGRDEENSLIVLSGWASTTLLRARVFCWIVTASSPKSGVWDRRKQHGESRYQIVLQRLAIPLLAPHLPVTQAPCTAAANCSQLHPRLKQHEHRTF